jgi:hypothetical protein
VYALLPWRWLGTGLTAVVVIAVYADEVARWVHIPISDSTLVRLIPLLALTVLGGVLGPTGYYAPWRILWRLCPPLNRWVFPDLNGVWVGSTKSNWPTIERMLQAAHAEEALAQAELAGVPPQEDAIAVEIKASLFAIRIYAALSSTEGTSHTLTARPRLDADSGRLHVTYVYEQSVPVPKMTDEGLHIGAADVQLDWDDPTAAEGVYWTQCRWSLGLNTAGRVSLRRIAPRRKSDKRLADYAREESVRLAG